MLLVGSGGIGTIAALNLERGNLAQVSCVLRSNYDAVMQRGFEIASSEHGHIQGWRPTESMQPILYISTYILLFSVANPPTFSIECCSPFSRKW